MVSWCGKVEEKKKKTILIISLKNKLILHRQLNQTGTFLPERRRTSLLHTRRRAGAESAERWRAGLGRWLGHWGDPLSRTQVRAARAASYRGNAVLLHFEQRYVEEVRFCFQSSQTAQSTESRAMCSQMGEAHPVFFSANSTSAKWSFLALPKRNVHLELQRTILWAHHLHWIVLCQASKQQVSWRLFFSFSRKREEKEWLLLSFQDFVHTQNALHPTVGFFCCVFFFFSFQSVLRLCRLFSISLLIMVCSAIYRNV